MNGHHRNPVILAVGIAHGRQGVLSPLVYWIRDAATNELRPPTMHEVACLLWRCWRGTRARVPRGWRL